MKSHRISYLQPFCPPLIHELRCNISDLHNGNAWVVVHRWFGAALRLHLRVRFNQATLDQFSTGFLTYPPALLHFFLRFGFNYFTRLYPIGMNLPQGDQLKVGNLPSCRLIQQTTNKLPAVFRDLNFGLIPVQAVASFLAGNRVHPQAEPMNESLVIGE